MSSRSTRTPTLNFAQQTATNGEPFQGMTPPLLPAFLITGLLLAVIVFIIVWRHMIERRRTQLELEDPAWGLDGLGGHGSNNAPKGPPPKLWDLEVAVTNTQANGHSQLLSECRWDDIMPLSAAPLRAKPKPRRPRYLVPSDRPISFLTRMFGSERRLGSGGERRSYQQPHTTAVAPTNTRVRAPGAPREENDGSDEEPIDRMQVAVLISLPHPRRVRSTSHSLDDNTRRRIFGSDISAPGNEMTTVPEASKGEVSEDHDASSLHSDKGKKKGLEDITSRSSEVTPSNSNSLQNDSNAIMSNYDDDDEGLQEVAFGTVIVPYNVEEG